MDRQTEIEPDLVRDKKTETEAGKRPRDREIDI